VQTRVANIAQTLWNVIDHNNCSWEEEYQIAIAMLGDAFERVPKEARQFITEKFIEQDLPAAAEFFVVTPRQVRVQAATPMSAAIN
jgi:hypothetical protein